jgi:hypothetical protein
LPRPPSCPAKTSPPLAALNTTKDALLAQIELKDAVDVFVDPGLR